MDRKVALVTGGNRGIGKEIALVLAEDGYDIALNYRRETEELENVKNEIELKGVNCLLVKGDVSIFEDCEKMSNKQLINMEKMIV